GAVDDARRSFDAAIKADPTVAPAANDLGVLLARDGHWTAAERALRWAVAADGHYALARFNLGIVLDHEGPSHLLEAQGSIGRAARIDGSFASRERELAFDDELY